MPTSIRPRGDVVIGVDAGGTHTRAICAAMDGTILGRAVGRGGSPNHNHDGRSQVHNAIRGALTNAGRGAGDVAALVAGLAGYDDESAEAWASDFTTVPGLEGCRVHLNDAEVAHAGAFAGGPGIIVIAGTGSMILGVTETGLQVRSGVFRHYAGGARHLSFGAIHRILIGEAGPRDQGFVDAVLSHWNTTPAALHQTIAGQADDDDNEVKRRYGTMAPLVTGHAATSPLANAALSELVDKTRVGVQLVAGSFGTDAVGVCLQGGLATASPFMDRLGSALADSASGGKLAAPQLGPTEGAVLLAIREVATADASTVSRLSQPENRALAADLSGSYLQ